MKSDKLKTKVVGRNTGEETEINRTKGEEGRKRETWKERKEEK
jgi:hypothetical protein